MSRLCYYCSGFSPPLRSEEARISRKNPNQAEDWSAQTLCNNVLREHNWTEGDGSADCPRIHSPSGRIQVLATKSTLGFVAYNQSMPRMSSACREGTTWKSHTYLTVVPSGSTKLKLKATISFDVAVVPSANVITNVCPLRDEIPTRSRKG